MFSFEAKCFDKDQAYIIFLLFSFHKILEQSWSAYKTWTLF